MHGRLITPANSLYVETDFSQQGLCLRYAIDDKFQGDLTVSSNMNFNFINAQLLGLFNAFSAVFLAQLCLAKHVHLSKTSKELLDALTPTVENLYAVRAYRDNLPFVDIPKFHIDDIQSTRHLFGVKKSNRVILSWSGGLDSTLSYMLLKKNDYDVLPVHAARTNTDAADSEFLAVSKLSGILGSPVEKLTINFNQYIDIASAYSQQAREYPNINSVPHGRELLLLPIMLIIALSKNASNICFGFENSTWTEQFEFNGKKYSRFDTQSEACNVNFQDIIQNFISKDIMLFSPVSPFSEYRKFKTIVANYPEISQNASFCYWGNSCGMCRKCTLYYLFQRALGLETIQFKHNPIIERASLILGAIKNWDDVNFRESNFAISKIIANKDIRAGEELLEIYKETVFPKTEPLLAAWQADLLQNHKVRLLPDGFNLFV